MAVVRLPGLIDVHVHLREPGATHKEDFASGTKAALAGGFTFVLDMPNNPLPTLSLERLQEKIELAKAKAVCEVGFHYGTDGKNLESFAAAANHDRVFGLKIYANHTTGDLLIEDPQVLEAIFAAWESTKPILIHAEKDRLRLMIELAQRYRRKLHVCHIARAGEVALVRKAKTTPLKISAGVCPHHLFLTEGPTTRAMGGYARMKPPLGNDDDQSALWAGLADGTIDLVETDHAPHTKVEKESEQPPFGVPGLETAAILLFRAAAEGRLPQAEIQKLLHDNPKRIFTIPDQPETFVEFELGQKQSIGAGGYQSKANWSPFEGWSVPAWLTRVVLRGQDLTQLP